MPQTEILIFRPGPDEPPPLLEWLEGLRDSQPKAYAKCLQRILDLERNGSQLRRPAADYLRDSIYELRTKVGRVNFRILYAFHGKNVAVLTHGFTKEDKVPDREIEAAIACMKLVRENLKKYTAEFEIEE